VPPDLGCSVVGVVVVGVDVVCDVVVVLDFSPHPVKIVVIRRIVRRKILKMARR
jgi:hypothetical protein